MSTVTNEDTVFHLFLVGESRVGKSSLLKRFVRGTYKEEYWPTRGIDFRACCVQLEGKPIKFKVNDVPGRTDYRTGIPKYYKNADGFIIVFDVTDEESFARVNDWLLELDKRATKDFTKILVGNKSDMQAERAISFEMAEELANKWSMKYLEASAKVGSNVSEIFVGIVSEINNRLHPPVEEESAYGKIRRSLESMHLSRPRFSGSQGPFRTKRYTYEPCDYNLNIILLGDVAVGKSCLMLRFTEDHFSNLYAHTIGLDFKIKRMELEGHSVKLQIVDTAGQEKFKCLTSSFYRGADGIIIVYDITNPESFFHLEMWMQEIDAYAREDADKVLVGTKCDLTDKKLVDDKQAKRFAKQLGIPFFEASAKNATNVEEVFRTLATLIIKRIGPPKRKDIAASRENLTLSDAPKKHRFRC